MDQLNYHIFKDNLTIPLNINKKSKIIENIELKKKNGELSEESLNRVIPHM